ncbi:MAG: hypothetical protein RSF40_08920 [Oscillospiraceae bacterium]
MKELFNVLIINLQYIGIAFGIFSLCVIANVIASLYHNTRMLKNKFDLVRFGDGFLKMITIGATTAILAIIVTLIPYMFGIVGVNIPEDISKLFTIGAIVMLYWKGIQKYYIEAYNTENDILENRNIIEDTKVK